MLSSAFIGGLLPVMLQATSHSMSRFQREDAETKQVKTASTYDAKFSHMGMYSNTDLVTPELDGGLIVDARP